MSELSQALAELNDEELRGFDKTREDLDTQVHKGPCEPVAWTLTKQFC